MSLSAFRLVFSVMRRFREERYAQTAAALSFATLLGLVPMIVIGAALVENLPFGIKMTAALEQFLKTTLLPEKAGNVIVKYLGVFADRAERMTWIGLGTLLLSGIAQMLTIEHAFNHAWRVSKPRPWLRRLGMHLLALFLGPLVFGAALATITYLATISFGWIDEPGWLKIALSQVIPFCFLTVLFALLYWALPNCEVSRWHAGLTAAMAASVFVGMQRMFALYVAKLPTYALVYGAFAAIPIFLSWLFMSWTVILVGALFTAEMSGLRRSRR